MISGPELRKFPFLRLLFPLIAGIIIADNLFFSGIQIPVGWLWTSVGLFLCLLVIVYFFRHHNIRQLFGFLVTSTFLILGLALTMSGLSRSAYTFPEQETIYRAVITSNAEAKSRSILYKADIIEKYDSVSTPIHRNVLLYFPPDSLSGTLTRGDEIILNSRISLPSNNGNPDEFNYPRYLIRKGISGSGFVASGQWRITSRQVDISWQERAFRCRDYILDLYRQSGFTGDEFAVLSALTVGYKEELSEEIRESFSVSGVSHVLALSGLHVGFIFALLFFVLKSIFGTSRWGRIVRAILTITALWFFAFMTGLSSSVVRSVLMFSLLALSSVRSGVILTGHSLSLAAFLMLIYNPEWLYDVGFQLSFVAVLGIILLQPRIFALWNMQNRGMRYAWGLLTVSTAAQIATAPLVIYYFSRFATHFLLTNLLVIPLVTVIIYGAVLMLLTFVVPGLHQLVATILQFLVKALNTIIRWVEQLPYASIDSLWLTPIAVLVIYLFLLLITQESKRRKGRNILLAMCCLTFLVVHSFWVEKNKPAQPAIAFYNIRHCPAVHCISEKGYSWLAYADSLPDYKRLTNSLSTHWNRRGLDEPEQVITDYSNDMFVRTDNFISFSGKHIYILNHNRWNGKYSESPMSIDYLYICRGFTSDIQSILPLFTVGQIVLDATLPSYQREKLQEESAELGIPCTSLVDGALVIEI